MALKNPVKIDFSTKTRVIFSVNETISWKFILYQAQNITFSAYNPRFLVETQAFPCVITIVSSIMVKRADYQLKLVVQNEENIKSPTPKKKKKKLNKGSLVSSDTYDFIFIDNTHVPHTSEAGKPFLNLESI